MGRTVILEPDGEPRVARVTFDRPEALNAVNAEVLGDLEEVVARLEADGEIAVVIVTGRGDRAFVAGGDIDYMAGLGPVEGERWVYRGQRVLRRLERLSQVTVAALNGFALGGGLEIALACDLRVAADTAVLGVPEVTVGLIPGWGGTQRLARLLGPGLAKDLVFTGRRVSAAEALAIGLVSRVVPAPDLVGACRELARGLLANSLLAIRQAKKAIDGGSDAGLDQGLDLEAQAWLFNFCSPDRVEGLRAFAEKRRPVYRRAF
jgi:enoyl-CoA hydratase